jgi:hypothetical protein
MTALEGSSRKWVLILGIVAAVGAIVVLSFGIGRIMTGMTREVVVTRPHLVAPPPGINVANILCGTSVSITLDARPVPLPDKCETEDAGFSGGTLLLYVNRPAPIAVKEGEKINVPVGVYVSAIGAQPGELVQFWATMTPSVTPRWGDNPGK